MTTDHPADPSAEPRATSEETPPPMKRYRFELTLDVHDFDHLADELRRIARDADLNDIPTERISGGGYWFTMTEREPTMTKGRYEAELRAWFDDVRRARHAR